jgi:hypothetical protein
VDVFDDKVIIGILKMCSVHLIFVLADVICEGDFPSSTFQSNTHQSDSGEKFRECALWRQREINHGAFLARQRMVRTLFFSNRQRAVKESAINCRSDQLTNRKPNESERVVARSTKKQSSRGVNTEFHVDKNEISQSILRPTRPPLHCLPCARRSLNLKSDSGSSPRRRFYSGEIDGAYSSQLAATLTGYQT